MRPLEKLFRLRHPIQGDLAQPTRDAVVEKRRTMRNWREKPAFSWFCDTAAANLRDRYEVVYEGMFLRYGGVRSDKRPRSCRSPITDDPLEALKVCITERNVA